MVAHITLLEISCTGKYYKERPQVYINKNFERKIVNISLPISFNNCYGRSKEPSH